MTFIIFFIIWNICGAIAGAWEGYHQFNLKNEPWSCWLLPIFIGMVCGIPGLIFVMKNRL